MPNIPKYPMMGYLACIFPCFPYMESAWKDINFKVMKRNATKCEHVSAILKMFTFYKK